MEMILPFFLVLWRTAKPYRQNNDYFERIRANGDGRGQTKATTQTRMKGRVAKEEEGKRKGKTDRFTMEATIEFGTEGK